MKQGIATGISFAAMSLIKAPGVRCQRLSVVSSLTADQVAIELDVVAHHPGG
jgi:hypothetical protein